MIYKAAGEHATTKHYTNYTVMTEQEPVLVRRPSKLTDTATHRTVKSRKTATHKIRNIHTHTDTNTNTRGYATTPTGDTHRYTHNPSHALNNSLRHVPVLIIVRTVCSEHCTCLGAYTTSHGSDCSHVSGKLSINATKGVRVCVCMRGLLLGTRTWTRDATSNCTV